ncbi:MAG: hypothetical protein R8J94_09730 [Acidimicrobiia bacterium]|nr:hypothetical protein [Acidimicrobiia bacterium]
MNNDFAELFKWYMNVVGALFLVALVASVGLALAGFNSAAIVVAVAVIAVVVPWKFVRQRSEFRQQISALQKEHSAVQAQLDRTAGELDGRLAGVLTKNTVRPILQEFRKFDRDRYNALHGRIAVIEDELAPDEDEGEEEVSGS